MSGKTRILVLALLVSCAGACGDNNSSMSAPTPVATVTGTWSGPLTVQGTPGLMTWTLTQNNASVSGPVLVGLPNGIVLLNGALSGTLTGSTLNYTITVSPGGIPTSPTCGGQLGGSTTVTLGASSWMTGNYTVLNSTCTTGFTSGDFTLTKGS